MRKDLFFRYLKYAIFLSLFFILFFSHKKSALAQIPSTTPQESMMPSVTKIQDSTQFQSEAMKYKLNTNPDVPHNLNTYTQSVFIEMLSTATCFLAGSNFINPQAKCLGVDQSTGKLGFLEENQGGLAMAMGNLIGQTYNIPVSSSNYVHYLAANFGITRNSYAQIVGGSPGNTPAGQGVGFIGLQSLLPIWVVFRNLSYLAFVLIFVLLGLGIMFRVNIDARTVMTIQNQIPKIIVGLILITLSYAIAGLLIDLMYVVTYLVINIFQQQGLETLTNINTNPFMAIGNLGAVNEIANPPAKSIGTIIASLFDGPVGTALSVIVGGLVGGMIGGIAGPIGGIVAGTVGGIGGFFFGDRIIQTTSWVIAYLVIFIAILSSLFRVWFTLIKAYVFIILSVIFAPFWIMIGLLPGGFGGVGPWLRSLIANLAAFPTVILLFMIGKSIIARLTPTDYNFNPPMIGNMGENSVSSVASIIGLGLILIMPEALNIVKSALKAPDFKLTSAAGRAIRAGQAFWSEPVERSWKQLTGERRDGTRGILRSTAEERANAIVKRMPIIGKGSRIGGWYQKRKEDERARARNRLYGTALPPHLQEAAQPAVPTPPENPPEAEEVEVDVPDEGGQPGGTGQQGGGPILPT